MARIKIIIADTDAAYANSLSDFLLAAYAQVFEVATFSRLAALEQYLSIQQSTGILLIAAELARPDFALPGLMQILLTAEPVHPELSNRQIFKYLSGSNLVQSLLRLYGECSETPAPLAASPKKAKVVAVYSPAGGTGKTTVAMGCSFQTAWEGNSVFYLNLENMPSTKLFFAAEAEEGLSTVLYYLQQKKNNVNLKIEALKLTDPHSQVHYFAPADSVMDLWEDMGDNLATLIQALRCSGFYDYVFIDLSSQINTNNLAVLEASDVVLLVSTLEPACQLKDAFLLTELQRWSARCKSNLLERIYPVWNKWELNPHGDNDFVWAGPKPLLKIPKVKNLLLRQGEQYCLDLNSPLGSAIFQIRAAIKD